MRYPIMEVIKNMKIDTRNSSRLDEIQAAFLRIKLKKLDDETKGEDRLQNVF